MNEQDISKAVEAVLGQMNGQHAHHAAGHVCKCKKHVMSLKLANALIEKVKAKAEDMGVNVCCRCLGQGPGGPYQSSVWTMRT